MSSEHWGPIRARSREEIRTLDRKAIEAYEIPGLLLMENAGRAAARKALAMLPDRGSCSIVCGKGNNGGDGFVIARHLHNLGQAVHIWTVAPPDEVDATTDAGTNLNILRRMNLPIQTIDPEQFDTFESALKETNLVVDALLGTGTEGAIRPPYDGIIETINRAARPVLAVDIPSGLDADGGTPLGPCIKARRTVTFAAPKLGFEAAADYTGIVDIIEISIPRELYEELPQD